MLLQWQMLLKNALRDKNAIAQLKDGTKSGEDIPDEVLQMIGDVDVPNKGPHISLVPTPDGEKFQIVYSKGEVVVRKRKDHPKRKDYPKRKDHPKRKSSKKKRSSKRK